jgi:CO/xanthine dehydrogenase FAD-binding subunit
MKDFSYHKAADLKSAQHLLAEFGEHGLLVAGGSNVMVDIRNGKLNGRELIGISDIAELLGLRFSRGKIIIGAATKVSEIAGSQLMAVKAPALYMAAQVFADPVIRNSATLGGNLAYASPAADLAPPLLALNAEIVLVKKGGKRRLALADFFLGVNRTVLEPGELISTVEFIANPRSAFYKLGLRNAMAISIATASVALRRERDGSLGEIRIAMGSVADHPLRCYHAEQLLQGLQPEAVDAVQLAKALEQDISPIDDIRASAAYRRAIAPVLVKRAINRACGRENAGETSAASKSFAKERGR